MELCYGFGYVLYKAMKLLRLISVTAAAAFATLPSLIQKADAQPLAPINSTTSITIQAPGVRSPTDDTLPATLTPRMPMLNNEQIRQFMRSMDAGAPRSTGVPGAHAPARPGQNGADAIVTSRSPTARNFGTKNIPYSTARVENSTISSLLSTTTQPAAGFPFVATGRLLMGFGTGTGYTSVCTASLIGKGLVVTAAHCVSEYGKGVAGVAKRIRFIPANNGNSTSSGPYGGWSAAKLRVPSAYLNGTDTCQVTGIVCNNDLAVIELAKENNKLPSDFPQIRYYAYGWNGYGNINNQNQVTQLGYPCGIDNCTLMQRNDSVGTYSGTGSGATPLQYGIGSQMTGGSSGGPWIINFGTPGILTGAGTGTAALRNVVQATTSWGYTDPAAQVQGASAFAQNPQFPNASYSSGGRNYGAGNIGAVLRDLCGTDGAQARGACF